MLLSWPVLVGLLLFLVFLALRSWFVPGLPGPRGIPFFGIAFELAFLPQREMYSKLKVYVDKYPGVVALQLVGHHYALLTAPETAEVLLTSSKEIQKGKYDYSFWAPFLKEGLLLSTGEKWRYRRKLLTPTFHFKILEDAMGSLTKNAQSLTSDLLATGGEAVDVGDMIRSTTLKVICETAMGLKLNTEDKQQNEYVEASKRLPYAIMTRFLEFWVHNNFIYKLTKAGRRFYKDLETVHSFTKKIIANRRQQYVEENKSEKKEWKKQRKAFLDCLLEMDISNQIFSEDDICEEVDTFMFEGHDTTSANVTFSMYLLANHPEVQEKVAEEMMEIFGNNDRPPTMQDLAKMNYLEMVIRESLRLYPSVPYISRTLTEDLKISDDVVIPAGYTVVVMIYFVHRCEEHWDNPEEFRPERFAPGTSRNPFAFIPFSAGPRNCIGQKFAMMELKTMLSTVIRKCRLEAVTEKINILSTGVMKTEEPIVIKFHPRISQKI